MTVTGARLSLTDGAVVIPFTDLPILHNCLLGLFEVIAIFLHNHLNHFHPSVYKQLDGQKCHISITTSTLFSTVKGLTGVLLMMSSCCTPHLCYGLMEHK